MRPVVDVLGHDRRRKGGQGVEIRAEASRGERRRRFERNSARIQEPRGKVPRGPRAKFRGARDSCRRRGSAREDVFEEVNDEPPVADIRGKLRTLVEVFILLQEDRSKSPAFRGVLRNERGRHHLRGERDLAGGGGAGRALMTAPASRGSSRCQGRGAGSINPGSLAHACWKGAFT